MGTPEFPDLGKHCSVDDCKLIDFLPFTCDRCLQVFCLDHRSYIKHSCPKGNRGDVTVVICPLCAKGVRLNPDEDPNITWEKHVNTDCDPSNYEKATKKKKCPVPRCREALTFSNTIKCRDCNLDHCLKHRFGPDHNCPGPKKPEQSFPFMGFLSTSSSRKEATKSNRAPTSSNSSSRWSSLLSSAEASLSRLSTDISQKLQFASSSNGGNAEECPQCGAKFSSVGSLVEHVEKVHERNGKHALAKPTIDACPKCSKGFRDPVDLVKHIERDHRGTSKA
ncbi:PREDICTED: zinc finger AN1 and C2H2 domain-containing stress-associated protein 13-like [Tarenaya hassleriana]|uniref:zinc finger AN1 and C2H2 domain-containing stress-associated protein 13-like n=1 Tax=Tarenaya hassleriana TaxID=28532 RepID=UPI00053C9D29|nr:PREDICTED: zinc finger AN1 and C2H2 domain-containing stress-associated protein 13-like [Tarenaya hassleriana]